MTSSFRLPFTVYRSPYVYRCPFTMVAEDNCELVIDNSLKIVNCKLKIAAVGGGL